MFTDRQDAGQQLAQMLQTFATQDVVVIGLARGGVAVAAVVAQQLRAPLGVILVRKIGHPSSPEYAIGALAEDEQPVYNTAELGTVDEQCLAQAEAKARRQIMLQRKEYYGTDLYPPIIAHKTVLLIDDGAATGLSMAAAIKAVRSKHVKRLVVALPVASAQAVAMLESLADEVVTLENPAFFLGAVAAHYRTFHQVTNRAVHALLQEAHHEI